MYHPTYNLVRHDRIDDAGYAAELRAEIYGEPFAIVDTGMGFAAVPSAELGRFGISAGQVTGLRHPLRRRTDRRERLNAALMAVTSRPEPVAS